MTIRIINLAFEYGSLIKLRFSEPDTPRPYAIPGNVKKKPPTYTQCTVHMRPSLSHHNHNTTITIGGKIGVILLCIPSNVLAIILLAGADWRVWVSTGAINGAIILL